ncbi:hypothetical protein [Neorhizobium alkalisoli]|uniref:Uncharacterized protein n=1 Tax=Neorhizobium alkalisoli TaxID=528178 RepID=A0A561QIE3_9HYPH|nr:hypothetical protein [Neorhizobium alkalisoli]TWF50133.1 hypothetical protein FHW37_10690 [Neorhizobium alkalisoli]
MHYIQHQLRSFTAPGAKWQWVAQTGLVVAAFLFVGAVTLGLFP